ncbi:superinfection immunity protein [Singulisphaera rosea]
MDVYQSLLTDCVPPLILGGAYFAPTIFAALNRRAAWADVGHIFLINLVLGWTVIGYLFALGLSLLDFEQIRRNNERKARVREAQAEFYLREQAKAASLVIATQSTASQPSMPTQGVFETH